MSVKMRLARRGAKKRPFYHIVAADARASRDGRFIEKLGTYNPMLPRDHEQRVVLNTERIQYWISQGAQPTERVAIFLGKAGLAAMPERRERPQKSKPKAKALEREQARLDKEEERKAAEAEAAEAAKAAAEAPAEEALAEEAAAAEDGEAKADA